MTYSTFIGPDGQTEISYQHGSDCECNECETTRWERIERENSKQSYGVYGLDEQERGISDEEVAACWAELQAKQLDAISAIQKEERDVAHSLYTALCGLWLAECGDRDMAEARTTMRARMADMRAFVDSVEVELGL